MGDTICKIRFGFRAVFCRACLPFFFVCISLNAQVQRYEVKRTSFSTNINDEFSPVFYDEGIVFCSNMRDNSLVGHQADQNRLLKMFYVSKGIDARWNFPKLLAKELTSGFNDGPATFTANGCTVYYSRNHSIEKGLKNILDPSNKLGIFSANLTDGKWIEIKPFTYNDPSFTLTTPALTTDGHRLYFSSDKPGGMGRLDLYYCDWQNNTWSAPANLGAVINTPGDESFPFVDKTGRLFFSSDGLPGYGGKDVFYTMEHNGEWIPPIHLDSAINSVADDFGLMMDSTLRSGYFSSNRIHTDDIYSFSLKNETFTNCDTVNEISYCYTFYDERSQFVDTLHLLYKWDFGNGVIREGREVKHCFPGPGEYNVILEIIDEITGDTIAEKVEYPVNLESPEQLSVHSNYVGMAGQSIFFRAQNPLVDLFNDSQYWWDFGDGYEPGGPEKRYTFLKKGIYSVKVGLISTDKATGIVSKSCVAKDIRICEKLEEFAIHTPEFDQVNSNNLQICLYLMEDLSDKQKQKIKVAFGKSKCVVGFDKYGLAPGAQMLMDSAAAVLQEDHETILDIVVHMNVDDTKEASLNISEHYAQVLAFYLKNKDVDTTSYRCMGAGMTGTYIKEPAKKSNIREGVVEFVFMKRELP